MIGIAVAMYVILDGFDLGIGILFPFAEDETRARPDDATRSRRSGTATKPGWCWAAADCWSPSRRAYAVIMPAFYLPVIVMLLALVFRGVAFEFRGRQRAARRCWNVAFAAGSTLAAFCQGVILGGLIQGIKVENGAFRRRRVRLGDAVRAAVRARRGGRLCAARRDLAGHEDRRRGRRARARRRRRCCCSPCWSSWRMVSLWTPLAFRRIAERWFSLPNFYLSVAGAAADRARRPSPAGVGSQRGREALPFLAAIGLFLLGYLGLVISWFPYLVPPSLTVWDAAAAPASQMFMLVGTLVLLPIDPRLHVVIYWLFRGKVRRARAITALSGRSPVDGLRRAGYCADGSPPSRSAAAAAGPESAARRRAALPAPGRESALAISGGGVPRVSVAGQTTTAPLLRRRPRRSPRACARGARIETELGPARRAERDQRREPRIARDDRQRLCRCAARSSRRRSAPISPAG